MNTQIEWLDDLFGLTYGREVPMDLRPRRARYGGYRYMGAFMVEAAGLKGGKACASLAVDERRIEGLKNAVILISDKFASDPLAQAALYLHERGHLCAGDSESTRTTEALAIGAATGPLSRGLGRDLAELVYRQVAKGKLPKNSKEADIIAQRLLASGSPVWVAVGNRFASVLKNSARAGRPRYVRGAEAVEIAERFMERLQRETELETAMELIEAVRSGRLQLQALFLSERVRIVAPVRLTEGTREIRWVPVG